MPKVRYKILIAIGIMLCVVTLDCLAKRVEVPLHSQNMIASAEYFEGKAEKPAILILHGFLQTNQFFTVNRLTNYLADEGYSVLSPTLTLGVSVRKKSLACEAMHTHTMEDDLKEIRFWLDWMKQKGHKNIVFVGHSFGSLQLLISLYTQSDSTVNKAILTSLVDIEHSIGKSEIDRQMSQAKELVEKNSQDILDFKLSFCKKYRTSPSAYLSYATWDKASLIEMLGKLDKDIHIIMGGNDIRMAQNWPNILASANSSVEVSIIDGANHFFDAEYEFELVDAVINRINLR